MEEKIRIKGVTAAIKLIPKNTSASVISGSSFIHFKSTTCVPTAVIAPPI